MRSRKRTEKMMNCAESKRNQQETGKVAQKLSGFVFFAKGIFMDEFSSKRRGSVIFDKVKFDVEHNEYGCYKKIEHVSDCKPLKIINLWKIDLENIASHVILLNERIKHCERFYYKEIRCGEKRSLRIGIFRCIDDIMNRGGPMEIAVFTGFPKGTVKPEKLTKIFGDTYPGNKFCDFLIIQPPNSRAAFFVSTE